MIQIQFGAKVKDAYGDVFKGFIDVDHPYRLRTLSTDVPVYEFETADAASEFVDDHIGQTRPADSEGRSWSVLSETDEDNEETWKRFAIIKDHGVE